MVIVIGLNRSGYKGGSVMVLCGDSKVMGVIVLYKNSVDITKEVI